MINRVSDTSYSDMVCTKEGLTRRDVFEEVKNSFIHKTSNYILSCKFIDHAFTKNIEKLHFNVLANKLSIINRVDGKLDKYSIDFSKKEIHFFYSEIHGKELPIYWNLYYVDAFYSILGDVLYNGVLNRLFKDNTLMLNLEEKDLLKDFIRDFLLDSNVSVKILISNEFGITYLDVDDQLAYLRDPFSVFKADLDDRNTLTGIFNRLEVHGVMNPSDESYNNFIYRLYDCDLFKHGDYTNMTQMPVQFFGDNSFVWVKQLYVDANYLNDLDKNDYDALGINRVYSDLHIDLSNNFVLSTYDNENMFMVDRKTEFNTSLSDLDEISRLDDIVSVDSDGLPNIGISQVGVHNEQSSNIAVRNSVLDSGEMTDISAVLSNNDSMNSSIINRNNSLTTDITDITDV